MKQKRPKSGDTSIEERNVTMGSDIREEYPIKCLRAAHLRLL